ncbi:MAG: tol-pal system YbgF family protein [Gemmatimonadales bacterium]
MRRKQRLERFGVMVIAALVSVGCATKGDIRNLQTEFRNEMRQITARQDSVLSVLRMQTTLMQDTLRTQSDQLFDFRGQIATQLQAISQSMARLEALSGENQRGIASVRDQLMRRGTAVTQPPLQMVDSAQVAGAGGQAVGGAGGNAEQLYQVARENHNRGSYATAQRAYEDFLQQFPNHALAPDAHLYLADVLILQDRPEDALETLQEIPTLFPTAARVPDALYRIAVLQREAGDEDDAKATLERIITTYPDSFSASLARELLEELN